jgi:hypothetical protein
MNSPESFTRVAATGAATSRSSTEAGATTLSSEFDQKVDRGLTSNPGATPSPFGMMRPCGRDT